MQGAKGPLDLTDKIIALEQGELPPDECLSLFGELVRTGLAWRLQGSYGRAAARLIEQGYLGRDGTILLEIDDD